MDYTIMGYTIMDNKYVSMCMWYILKSYTFLSMMLNNYAESIFKRDTIVYPFTIIKRDGFKQIYYSKIVPTSYTLINVELSVNNKDIYILDMKEFMVVGNKILDYEFIKYILYNDHGVMLTDKDNYTLQVMDDNVNQVSVTSNEYMMLESSYYAIYTYD